MAIKDIFDAQSNKKKSEKYFNEKKSKVRNNNFILNISPGYFNTHHTHKYPLDQICPVLHSQCRVHHLEFI